MKILIDIGHPAHVHYFRNLISLMEKKGHTFLIITRDKEITHELLTTYNLKYISRGKGKNTLAGKIIYAIRADYILYKHAQKWKPDLFLSFGSPYAAHVSKLLNKPHVSLTDTEHAKLGILAFLPFTDIVLTPDVFQKELGAKQIKFRSYIELAYLHKKYFIPIEDIKKELGLNNDQKFVLFRYVSWGASHDLGESGLTDESKKRLIKLFLDYGYKVFISSEGSLDDYFETYKIKISPHKIHSVLYAADFFIGESGTMATEAAILGTPSFFVNSLNAGVFEDEVKHKVLYSFRNTIGLENKIKELIEDEDIKNKHYHYKEILLNNKIDVTTFLAWFIEDYPGSLSIMKQNPDYQNRFLNSNLLSK